MFCLRYILALTILLANLNPSSGETKANNKGSSLQRSKRESSPVKDLRNAGDSVWGGQCFRDSDCVELVSYCDKSQGFPGSGECRLVWWVWLLIALVLLFIFLSCLACICLPCCCLYNCCAGILSCISNILCCCCSRRRGYTVARTG